MKITKRFLVTSVLLVTFTPFGLGQTDAGQPSREPISSAAGPSANVYLPLITRLEPTWYVAPNGNDQHVCHVPTQACATIHGAIAKATSGNTIKVTQGNYTSANAEVVLINKNIRLTGGWDSTFTDQTGDSVIEGAAARRGVTIIEGVTAYLDHFIIQNGQASAGGGLYNNGTLELIESRVISNTSNVSFGISTGDHFGGGGIHNTGTLTLNASSVAANTSATRGGGIVNLDGIVTLINSTIANNIANVAGGLYNYSSSTGTVTLYNSTVAFNEAVAAGGIDSPAGSIDLLNTIVSQNRGINGAPDCNGIIKSLGYSLVGDITSCFYMSGPGDLPNTSAGLVLVAGTPEYSPLFPASPAIDAGDPSGCLDNTGTELLVDIRGMPRKLDGDSSGATRCDIGAYEFDPAHPSGQIFIPVVSREIYRGIHGIVSLAGSPITGVDLELRFFDGANWSTFAHTVTDANGLYSFPTAPSLSPGQRYYVLYSNPENNPGRLGAWFTRQLETYIFGQDVVIGNFELGQIYLSSPQPGATVSLPFMFQWYPRWAIYTDSYGWEIFDPFGLAYFATPPLGYTGGYTVSGLPSGFETSKPYAWYVSVYSPDGGYGFSYYAKIVYFSNSGQIMVQDETLVPLAALRQSGEEVIWPRQIDVED